MMYTKKFAPYIPPLKEKRYVRSYFFHIQHKIKFLLINFFPKRYVNDKFFYIQHKMNFLLKNFRHQKVCE